MWQPLRIALQIVPALGVLFAPAAGAGDSGADPHAAHRQMLAAPETKVVHASYSIPDVTLVDASGSSKRLRDVFDEHEPVVVNFIFTTCTTICPVMTATTLQLKKHLDAADVQPKIVSISIDPDYDTATVLKEYAESYGADWTFLTGSSQDIVTTLNAFDAYRGNKINHFALTLMRGANTPDWTRVEGLTSASELARIWREVVL